MKELNPPKLDCSLVVNFVSEQTRMCNTYWRGCRECPMYHAMHGYIDTDLDAVRICDRWIMTNILEALRVVQKWSDENPKEQEG